MQIYNSEEKTSDFVASRGGVLLIDSKNGLTSYAHNTRDTSFSALMIEGTVALMFDLNNTSSTILILKNKLNALTQLLILFIDSIINNKY